MQTHHSLTMFALKLLFVCWLVHFYICIHTYASLIRPGKTDLRPETQNERLGPIPDPTPEICSSESGPELNHTRPEIFYKVACFTMKSVFDQNLVDPKSTQTEPYPTQTETTRNVT